MNTNTRRSFLKKTSLLAGAFILPTPLSVFAGSSAIYIPNSFDRSIRFYHTSDLNGKLHCSSNGMGGLQLVATNIERKQYSSILLDAGNFLSPMEDREAAIDFLNIMNSAQYTGVNVGLNELINGEDYFASLISNIKFPLINSNYNFSNEKLGSIIKPFIVVEWGTKRIGITGVGSKVKGIGFNSPQDSVNEMVHRLKRIENVDVIICLSDLRDDQDWNNKRLAENTKGVDFFVAVHSSRFLLGGKVLKNQTDNDVMICPGGRDGLLIGQIDLEINTFGTTIINNHQFIPGLKNPAKFVGIIHELNNNIV